MKQVSLLFLTVIASTASAQRPDSLIKRNFFLKASYISTEVTFPKLDQYQTDLLFFSVKEGRTFGGGGASLSFGYSTAKMGLLEAGLSVFFADQMLSNRSISSPEGSTYTETTYRLQGLRLPVTLSYNLTKRPRRIMFDAVGGLELLAAKVERTRLVAGAKEVKESSVFRPNILLGPTMNLKLTSSLKFIYGVLLSTNYNTLNGVAHIGLRSRLNKEKHHPEENDIKTIN